MAETRAAIKGGGNQINKVCDAAWTSNDCWRRAIGRDLRTDAGGDPYDAPAALLMHGKEADPVFCYANRTAQICGA